MKIKVYVLKEYEDDLAYGEELIRLFATKKEAEEALRKDAEDWAGVPFEEIPKALALCNECDSFEPDYISKYYYSGGYTNYFIIEEHTLDLPAETEQMIYNKVWHGYNMLDAKRINEETYSPEDQLTNDELEDAVDDYEQNLDWNFPYADQLQNAMDQVKEDRDKQIEKESA